MVGTLASIHDWQTPNSSKAMNFFPRFPGAPWIFPAVAVSALWLLASAVSLPAAVAGGFKSVELVGPSVQLTLDASQPGLHRRVDASEDLSSWRPIALFPPAVPSPSLLQEVSAGKAVFYRVSLVTNQLAVFRITPGSAEPGAVISIDGQFFSSQPGSNAVSFPGGDAKVLSASATRLEVQVPASARSGPVTVRVGSSLAESPDPFIPLRRVAWVVRSPLGSKPHVAFGFAGAAEDLAADAVIVRADIPTIVHAAPAQDDSLPGLMAMVLPGDAAVEFSSASTATALLFSHPAFATRDQGLARVFAAKAGLNPEAAAFAAWIESRWPLPGDPFDDPQLAQKLGAAVASLLSQTRGMLAERMASLAGHSPQLAASNSTDDFGFDLEYTRIAPENEEDEPLGPLARRYTWTLGPKFPWVTSVDWIVVVKRMDVAARFPGGFLDLDVMLKVKNPLQNFPFLPGFEYRGNVEPYLVADKLNPVKKLVEVLFTHAVDKLRTVDKTLLLPDEPAIYVSRAIGPGFGPGDEAAFAFTAYRQERLSAMAYNVTAAVMDLFGIVIDLDGIDYDKAEILKYLTKVELEASKRAPSIHNADDFQENVIGLFNFMAQEFADLMREKGTEALARKVDKKLRKKAVKALQRSVKALASSNVVVKALDVINGIGVVAQRTLGMLNSTPMETALIIVGEPFKIQNIRLTPAVGAPDSELTLQYPLPAGVAGFDPVNPADRVEFDGPVSFRAEVISVEPPGSSGLWTLRLKIPSNFPSLADGSYAVTLKTRGRRGTASFTLTNKAIVLSASPLEGFAATANFEGSAFDGSVVSIQTLNVALSDIVYFGSPIGQVEAVTKSLQGGLLRVSVPKGAGTGPIKIRHKEKNGALTDVFTPTFTVLGAPVLESASLYEARRGDAIAYQLRNSTAEPGTTLVRFTGSAVAISADFRAGLQIAVVPLQATSGPVRLSTPAGSVSVDLQLLPGLAKGGTIQIGSAAITNLQRGCDFANGTDKPFDDADVRTEPGGGQVSLDPPFEEGDFVTDKGVDQVPRFPVGGNFADTIQVGDVGGEGVLTGDFEKIDILSGFRGVLRVRGSFCSINALAPFSGTVILEGSYCKIDGFRGQTTFSGSAGCPLIIRGSNSVINVRLVENAGDGMRIEGGSFNRIQIIESRGNGGSGVVVTGGARGNSIQILSGVKSGALDVLERSGNARHGLLLLDSASDNVITAFSPGLGGNLGDGLRLDGVGVSNNVISVARYLRNGGNGVTLTNDASFNRLFDPIDPQALFRNIFLSVSNAAHGVAVYGGTGNRLSFASSGNGGDGLLVSRTRGPQRSTRIGMRTYDFETRGNAGAGARINDGAQGLWLFGTQGPTASLTSDGVGLVIEGDEVRGNLIEFLTIETPLTSGMRLGGSSNWVDIDVRGAGQDGVVMENSRFNSLRIAQISDSGSRGLVMGTGAEANEFTAGASGAGAFPAIISDSKSDGIVIASGAKWNRLSNLLVRNNQGNGILIQNQGTEENSITSGRVTGNRFSAVVIGYGASFNAVGPGPANTSTLELDSGTGTNPVVVILGQESRGNILRRSKVFSTQPPATRQIGVSIRDGASGTLVESNLIQLLSIGLETRDGVNGIGVRANSIKDNSVAGMTIRGATNFLIGGGKTSDANAFENQPIGILMEGADVSDGAISYNTFVQHTTCGIRLVGTAKNRIGPLNRIVNGSRGIELINAGQNRIFDNLISQHSLDGLRISGGSAQNSLARNRITANATGIAITGAGSIFNIIVGAGIFNNTGKGIDLSAGGNNDQPSPSGELIEGGLILGRAAAPDQSVVSLFRDRADEGEEWLADALVSDGRWRLQLNAEIAEALAASRINAWVTTPAGDTSEFAPIFRGGDALPLAVFVSTRDGNQELYRVDGGVNQGQFGAPQRLTANAAADFQPSLSPDGAQVVFTSERNGQRDIYLRSSSPGSTELRLTSNTASDESPVWLGADQILFTSTRGGPSALYRMNLAGANVLPVSPGAGVSMEAASSRDGSRIAFVTTRRGSEELFVAEGDGSNPRPLRPEGVSGRQPAWSPSGLNLAFHSTRNGRTDIYIMRADGAEERRLTDGEGINRDAAWTLDGLGIVFTSDRSGGRELYYVPAAGGSAFRLTITNGESFDADLGAR